MYIMFQLLRAVYFPAVLSYFISQVFILLIHVESLSKLQLTLFSNNLLQYPSL